MTQSLTRRQALALGLAVLLAVILGAGGLAAIAARDGFWKETTEVTVGFTEAHDVTPGTPVRIRGVEAGQVVAVEYPDQDGLDARVTVRMKLHAEYASRLYGDATAQVHATGLLGGKVIAIRPGTPAAGPLPHGQLRAEETADLARVAADAAAAAEEARELLREIRTANGTLGKLLRDDELYQELKGLARDSRQMVKRADQAVDTVEGEAANVKQFVQDGRDTLRSVKQGTDALQKLPIVRSYIEDAAATLVRPTHRKDGYTYNTQDLFEPGTAILTEAGKIHLETVVGWLKDANHSPDADVVISAFCDPKDPGQTSASANELTRKQAETVEEYLRNRGVHKIGWVSRRKITTVGLGFGPSPVPATVTLPPSYVQVLLFTPAG